MSICDLAVGRSADILIIFDWGKRWEASVWEKTAYKSEWVIKLSKWGAYEMTYVGVSMMSNKKLDKKTSDKKIEFFFFF